MHAQCIIMQYSYTIITCDTVQPSAIRCKTRVVIYTWLYTLACHMPKAGGGWGDGWIHTSVSCPRLHSVRLFFHESGLFEQQLHIVSPGNCGLTRRA